jgi:hypothetical protein
MDAAVIDTYNAISVGAVEEEGRGIGGEEGEGGGDYLTILLCYLGYPSLQ